MLHEVDTKKKFSVHLYFSSFPRANALAIPPPTASMALRAPDPDSEGVIIYWNLSSPTAGTPTPIFSTYFVFHHNYFQLCGITYSSTISPSLATSRHPPLVFAFYVHTTRFWTRESALATLAFVVAPGCAKPASAAPEDDEDDSFVVTQIRRRGRRCNMVRLACCHGRRAWRCGFPARAMLCLDSGFGGGEGGDSSGGGRQNGPSSSSAADGQGSHGGRQGDDLAYRGWGWWRSGNAGGSEYDGVEP